MSETHDSSSMSHKLNGEDDTSDDASDFIEEEEPTQKRGRKQGSKARVYVYHSTIPTFTEVQSTLKNTYIGTSCEQGNAYNNIVWFKCKSCTKTLKEVEDSVKKECHIHIQTDFFDENGEHNHSIRFKKEKGIPEKYRTEIDRFDELSVKPSGIVEEFRRKGNFKKLINLKKFNFLI
jgi:hypothetical protein